MSTITITNEFINFEEHYQAFKNILSTKVSDTPFYKYRSFLSVNSNGYAIASNGYELLSFKTDLEKGKYINVKCLKKEIVIEKVENEKIVFPLSIDSVLNGFRDSTQHYIYEIRKNAVNHNLVPEFARDTGILLNYIRTEKAFSLGLDQIHYTNVKATVVFTKEGSETKLIISPLNPGEGTLKDYPCHSCERVSTRYIF